VDENKAKKLREIGYQIRGCCGLCVHFLGAPRTGWGTCANNRYKHKKHVGDERNLSVSIYGWCDAYEFHPATRLHAFSEFTKGDKVD